MNTPESITVDLAHGKYVTRNCDTCGERYTGRGRFFCSPKCQPRGRHQAGSKALITGKKHPLWKEDVGYGAVHMWIRRTFGKANVCENPKCVYPRKNKSREVTKYPKRFEWALIHGQKYEKKRENFISLCKSCHASYDLNLLSISL